MLMAQYNLELTDKDIKITAAATAQMAALAAQAEEPVAGIRVYVNGGGCSGMNYGMTYAETTTSLDKTKNLAGFQLVIDCIAFQYLKGCEIDFVQDEHQSSFVFNHVFQSVGGSGGCGSCGGGQH